MALTKPSWLRSALDRLNWDIFTWRVYVGDAIERGIDWALDWINWGIDQAGRAFNKAVDAWNYGVELGRYTLSVIYREVDRLGNIITAWWADLGEWWLAKLQDIKDRIQAAKDWLQDRIDEAQKAVNILLTTWDNFRTGVLPGLLDTTWIRTFFGRGISSISEWWSPHRRGISEEIDGEVSPVRDEVNSRTDIFTILRHLVTDPLHWPEHFARWALNWLETILARLW